MSKIYTGNNTHYVTLESLVNNQTGQPISGATVTCTIKHEGLNVGGVVWPVTLDEDTDGVYSAAIPAMDDIKGGRAYQVIINVDAGGSLAEFRETVYAENRVFNPNC